MTLPSIAIIGERGVGKATIAKALVDRHGYSDHDWQQPIRTLASWAYGPITDTRGYEVELAGLPTQLTGREVIDRIRGAGSPTGLDEDFWVRVVTRNLDSYPIDGPSVNVDTRYENELTALARRGWVIVRLACPPEIREMRLKHRDGAFIPSDDADPLLHLLDNAPTHLTVHNTASPGLVADTLVKTLAQYAEQGGVFSNRNA